MASPAPLTMQLDDVHGGHGKPSAVNHAADIAVQGDVVQVVVGGLNFPGVLLAPIPLVKHSLLSEVGVVVKLELGIKAYKVAGVVLSKGVDLNHGGILVLEELVQVEKNLGDLWHLLRLNSNPGCNFLSSSSICFFLAWASASFLSCSSFLIFSSSALFWAACFFSCSARTSFLAACLSFSLLSSASSLERSSLHCEMYSRSWSFISDFFWRSSAVAMVMSDWSPRQG